MAVENNAPIPTPPIAGYKYSRALTIDGTKATANLTNFPVLVAQTIPMLANVTNGGHVQNANGYDILFAANVSGTTRLNWEMESYNSTTGAMVAWVQVPNIQHGLQTTI